MSMTVQEVSKTTQPAMGFCICSVLPSRVSELVGSRIFVCILLPLIHLLFKLFRLLIIRK